MFLWVFVGFLDFTKGNPFYLAVPVQDRGGSQPPGPQNGRTSMAFPMTEFRSVPIRPERCRRSAVFLGMQPEVKAKEENTPKDVQNPAIFSKPCNCLFR